MLFSHTQNIIVCWHTPAKVRLAIAWAVPHRGYLEAFVAVCKSARGANIGRSILRELCVECVTQQPYLPIMGYIRLHNIASQRIAFATKFVAKRIVFDGGLYWIEVEWRPRS